MVLVLWWGAWGPGRRVLSQATWRVMMELDSGLTLVQSSLAPPQILCTSWWGAGVGGLAASPQGEAVGPPMTSRLPGWKSQVPGRVS